MARNRWTPDEDADVRELYPTTPNRELARILNGRHGNGRNANSVNQRARKLDIRKSDDYRHPMPRPFWTDERIAWFRAFVPGHTEPEISAEHERVFGTPLTEGQIGSAKTKFGVRSGTHGGCFQKGDAAWNKGKRQADFMSPEAIERTKATRFKKGEVHGYAAQREQPVGSERVSKDGYVEVKVADGLQSKPNKNFRMKHHIEYEKAHGPIPDGCNVVFADGDKRNFDPDNLVAVPRELWAVMCKMGLKYRDRESLEACMNAARLNRAVHAVKCRPRECKKCGREFEPRFPNQKTCDMCLGR